MARKTDDIRWHRFWSARQHAKRRGIDFQFTGDEWITWWGDDFHKRGRSMDSLQMCRYNDTGPYHPDNVYKATTQQNLRDQGDRLSKRIMTDDGEFESQTAAALALGVSQNTIGYRIKSKNFPDFYRLTN